ncbi:unnamed protein product [Mytilus coruscus]|uniref:C2H2-type domain-containing protein n=1 Tax=Mytilus coruscus TaxID=42192 RepID=A0A6J8EIX1_MYTCO|nr:unnamed protein product [Mytilus coruscus]
MDSKQCHVCGEVFINVSVVWSHISSHSRKEIYDCLVAFKSSLEIFMKQYFALKEYVDSYLIQGNCKDNEDNGQNNSTANMVGENLHSDRHVFHRKDQNSDLKSSERIKNIRKERCKSNDETNEQKEQPDDDVVVLTETDFRHETKINHVDNRFISDNDRSNKFDSEMGDNSLSVSKGDNLNPKSGETSFSELTNLQTKSDVEHNLSVIDLSEVEHEEEDMNTKLEMPYDPLETDIQTNTYQEKESEKTTKNMYMYATSNHKGENDTDNHKNVRDIKPVLTVTGKTIQMIAREISLNSGRDRIMKETTCEECGRTFATKFRGYSRLRIRKEIRTISEDELENVIDAVKALKSDTSVSPKKYDSFVIMHMGGAERSAHDGPNFVSWHRYFCLLFENALREVDENSRSVTLPYWDSRADFLMKNREDSILFTEIFLGNPKGVVYSGPFAFWSAPTKPVTLLRRDVGTFGHPIHSQRLKEVFKKRYHREILNPTVPKDNYANFESHHDMVHGWVGGIDGHMGDVNLSPADPVFWLHHCFVDYLWEKFRERQTKLGINSETDYPVVPTTNPGHLPNRSMDNLIPPKTNIQGYSNSFTKRIYRYADAPTCGNKCGGAFNGFLFCDRS